MATPGNTTARGYGHRHQQIRKILLAEFQPGQPCARCGKPIHSRNDADLGHGDDRRSYRGLEHVSCNRRDGARRRNQQRRVKTTTWTTTRDW